MIRKPSKLFSPGLYIESLRQLRLMGLVYLVLCAVFSALPPLLAGTSIDGFRIYEHAAVLYLYDFIAPVTLAYTAFGYLTRRNASDFYHSMPVTREATYFSRSLAILTYLAGTILCSLLISFALCSLRGVVSLAQFPYLFSFHLLSSFLVLSCALVGLSCTGTVFSSFVVAGLALFLPRMILTIVAATAQNAASILYPETMGWWMNVGYNLPVSMFAGLFSVFFSISTGDSLACIAYLPAHLYTAVVGLVWYAVGCILHHRRPSELARSAAPNRTMQHIFRCLISLPLFLILGTTIATGRSLDVETVVFLAVCATLVYFLYELVTTRKARNLPLALAILPAVVAVGLALPWLGKLVGSYELHRLPDLDRIESVNLDVPSSSPYREDYTQAVLSKSNYTGEEIIALTREALSNTIEYYDGDLASSDLRYSCCVRFNLKNGGSLTRRVTFTPEGYRRLLALYRADPCFDEALSRLPSLDQLTGLRLMGTPVSAKQSSEMREIWETFCDEYASLSTEDKQSLLVSSTLGSATIENDSPTPADTLALTWNFYDGYLSVSFYQGPYLYYVQYRITSLTPKTLLTAMRLHNADPDNLPLGRGDNLDEVLRVLDESSEGESDLYLYGTLFLYDPEGQFSGVAELYKNIEPASTSSVKLDPSILVPAEYTDTFRSIIEVLKRGDPEITDLNAPIVRAISIGSEDYVLGSGMQANTPFLRLSPEDFELLIELLSE